MSKPWLMGTSWLIAGCAATFVILTALKAGADPAADTREVSWSSIVFQASRVGSTATTEIRTEALAAAAEAPKFLESPKGSPAQASGSEIHKLSVVTTVAIPGGKHIRLENHLWFDPRTNSPLYLERSRLGLVDYHQRFRFTREGVFRNQREPASAGESEKSPEHWNRIGRHFYPFPSGPPDCPMVFETSQLIPLADAILADPAASARPLCIFHKRQVHRVNVYLQPVRTIRYDYLERSAEGEIQRAGAVSAQGARITSRPIGSYRGDVEDFFKDGTQLWFSPGSRLPLAVSGELPVIGWVEMQLKEIRLKTSKK